MQFIKRRLNSENQYEEVQSSVRTNKERSNQSKKLKGEEIINQKNQNERSNQSHKSKGKETTNQKNQKENK